MVMDERLAHQWDRFEERMNKQLPCFRELLAIYNILHHYGGKKPTDEERAAWERRQERAGAFGGRSYRVRKKYGSFLDPIIITKDLDQWYCDAEYMIGLNKGLASAGGNPEMLQLLSDRHLLKIGSVHDLRDIHGNDTLDVARERMRTCRPPEQMEF